MRELNKMDLNWVVTRLPADVRALLMERGDQMFLAGGYIRAAVANEKANDIDLFTPTKGEAQAWAGYMAEKRKKKTIKTDNAITIKGDPPIQFIHRWTFSDPVACIESFDFTIAQAVVWYQPESHEQELERRPGRWRSACSDRFYEDLAARRLVYTSPSRAEAAGGSMLRVLKFYQRGYRIDLDSLGKVIARISMGDERVRSNLHEDEHAKVLSGLLREVDPSIDPDHMAHLPSGDGHAACDED